MPTKRLPPGICALCLCLALATSLGARAAAPGTPSLIEVPIRIDLTPLFRAADERLPREAGHWLRWEDWHGIKTRYRAWRGPLSLSLSGDVLQAQAHVRYWARARKDVIGRLGLDTGCGVDEPPRQALIGMSARLVFAPDWTLRPSLRVLPPRFLDACEVTILGIDVTPILGDVFTDRLEETLHEAMGELGPRLMALRGQAARLWAALQEPMPLVPGVWLTARPLAVGLAPPQGQGVSLDSALGLVLDLAVQAGDPPPAGTLPLPPLQAFLPRGEGVHFDLPLALNYQTLGQALSQQLTGKTVAVKGQTVEIRGLELGAKGGDLVVTVQLAGAAPGVLILMARPSWEAKTGSLHLTDLGFVFDAEDPDQALAVGVFYERIRDALELAANGLLREHTGDVRAALQAALGRVLARADLTGVGLDLSDVTLRDLRMEVGTAGLRLTGSAGGQVKVRTGPL
jgi:hypothetical protein